MHFQILTPPGIKLICGLQFSNLCRDIHFQDFEDLSSFRYKIKFTKCHFGLEKTYIAYTCNVPFFSVQYIMMITVLMSILMKAIFNIHNIILSIFFSV